MARARTIKPQFLRSRSMRRVSRDAQLTFIRLWLAADDAGRLRESVHGMGYQLYPGDPDAQSHVAEWLSELEREHCIERYTVDRTNYMRVVNWRKYQRISHPTPSRLPARPVARERAEATHEPLASAAPQPKAGQRIGCDLGNSGAIHEPRESLAKEAERPLPGGLLGRFHERFTRPHFFRGQTAGDAVTAPSPADAPRDRRR